MGDGSLPAARWGLAALTIVALAAAGCGGQTASKSQSATSTAAAAPPPQTPPVVPVYVTRHLAPNPWKEPTEASLRPHPGVRVGHVIVHDLKQGTGPAVRPGDVVKMDFIESNWTSGHEFMRAWGGEPYPTAEVNLSPDAVMRGLVIGMNGMRVGGHRTILVPRRLSDVNDSDRAGNSYKEIVYYDVVLRGILIRGH